MLSAPQGVSADLEVTTDCQLFELPALTHALTEKSPVGFIEAANGTSTYSDVVSRSNSKEKSAALKFLT